MKRTNLVNIPHQEIFQAFTETDVLILPRSKICRSDLEPDGIYLTARALSQINTLQESSQLEKNFFLKLVNELRINAKKNII